MLFWQAGAAIEVDVVDDRIEVDEPVTGLLNIGEIAAQVRGAAVQVRGAVAQVREVAARVHGVAGRLHAIPLRTGSLSPS